MLVKIKDTKKTIPAWINEQFPTNPICEEDYIVETEEEINKYSVIFRHKWWHNNPNDPETILFKKNIEEINNFIRGERNFPSISIEDVTFFKVGGIYATLFPNGTILLKTVDFKVDIENKTDRVNFNKKDLFFNYEKVNGFSFSEKYRTKENLKFFFSNGKEWSFLNCYGGMYHGKD